MSKICVKKKLYAVFAVVGLICGIIGTGSVAFSQPHATEEELSDSLAEQIEFEDVSETDWFYEYVTYLTENGIVNGMTETLFDPYGTFTVAQSAAIISRYLSLEDEAAERKEAMTLLGVEGADLWYSGYIQIMHEACIMDVTEYGCNVNGESIAINSTELFDAPVKRYEFATFITRSFELDGTEIRAGENGDSFGHEFILNGAYDESKLELYIPYIRDYDLIPSEYRYYILKAYYNGIFNGDDLGNFNPLNNLTRGEMAKVTAVIMNPELRKVIDVSENRLPESYLLDDSDYLSKHGQKLLKHTSSDKILELESVGIKIMDNSGTKHILYEPVKNAPDGFKFEIKHYRPDNSGFDTEISDSAELTSDYTYKNTFNNKDKFILLLKDSATGETVDAYQISFNMIGEVVRSHCSYNA